MPAFFKWIFLHEKRGLEVRNFLTFPNSLETFRKSKKNCFFTVFWGNLEGAGTWCPRCTQATFKGNQESDATIEIFYNNFRISITFNNFIEKPSSQQIITTGLVSIHNPSPIKLMFFFKLTLRFPNIQLKLLPCTNSLVGTHSS